MTTYLNMYAMQANQNYIEQVTVSASLVRYASDSPSRDRETFGLRYRTPALALLVLMGCATVPRVTPVQLRAWCAIQAYELGAGRSFAEVQALGRREHIAVRMDRQQLHCFTIG